MIAAFRRSTLRDLAASSPVIECGNRNIIRPWPSAKVV